MIIFTVDDERLALEHLTGLVNKCLPDETVFSFRDPKKAYEAALKNKPDVVFSDIKMRSESGVEFASRLLRVYPAVNIIFTTGFRDYMEEALNMHVSGYIVKPVTLEKVKHELDNLRYPVSVSPAKRLRVQTFGLFAVFYGGEPVQFSFSKTWELFAVLIDQNGCLCSTGQLSDILWEDGQGLKKHGSYFQNLLSDLSRTLKQIGCEDVLIRKRGMVGVDKTKIDCDYYGYLDGKPEALRAFKGEYMRQYSWAEETLAFLNRR